MKSRISHVCILTKIFLNICFRGLGFWIAIIIGLFLCISQYVNESLAVVGYLDAYQKVWPSMLVPHSVFTKWIGGELFSFEYFAFFMIIPLLANLPCGNGVAVDVKSRYIVNIISRENRRTYYAARMLSAFLSGGIVVVFPLTINLLLNAVTLPSIVPHNAMGAFSIRNGWFLADLFYEKPYVYIAIYLFIIFVFSGLICATSAVIGIFGISPFLNLLYPFLVNIFLYSFLGEFEITAFTPFYFLNPSQGYKFIPGYVLLEMGIMIIVIVVTCTIGKKMDVY